MEPLKIGNIILPHRAVFGPMAGFTDAPCRRLMAQHGAGFTVSEMVSSRALVYGDHKTVSLLKAAPNGHPMACRSLAKCRRSWAKPPPPSNSTSSTLWTSTWAARPPRSCPAAAGQQADAGPGPLRAHRGAGGGPHQPPCYRQDAQGLGCRPHHRRGVRQGLRAGGRGPYGGARPHPGADVHPGHRPGDHRPGKGCRPKCRCWATATSTRPRMRCAWCRRPAATA